ncbi:hypothetical protein [Amycolatopsis sp. NPDC049868]|uniref:hypothetical protein n=1 Tax=Amycolatopsis sp. NPDC049868 TaxID=3363934 RepID=UPI003789C12E
MVEPPHDVEIQLLEEGIREAVRTGADFVVVRGPAEITIPLVDDWATENRDLWDTHLRVDLYTYAYRRTVVAIWTVAANLLSAVSDWRYRPRTTRMRAAWYRRIVQQRTVLLRLHNAHGAPAVRWFSGGAPGSLVIVTARTRLWMANEKVIWVDLRPGYLSEGPSPPWPTTLDT